MISLRTSDLLEILNDFLTPPLYEGRGRWANVMEVIREIKHKELSGILLLQSSGSKIFNFFDYGEPLGSLAFEEGTMFSYPDDEFFRERSGMKHIRPFRYRFSPLNSDVVMVVASFHRSSVVMDSITPFPDKVVSELTSLEFSGILRSYSPVTFSAVFLEGIVSGVFAKGEMFNLNDLLKAEGELYEFKVFSVKEQLYERSYAQMFKKLYGELRHLYVRMSRAIRDFPTKVRMAMLERSYSDPVLDPIIGLIEPTDNDILFYVSKRRGLYVLESFLDVLEDVIVGERELSPNTVKKFKDDIRNLRVAVRDSL